jgi:ATP-binding cassette subfamily B (MDR/TAP) protein 1
MGYYSPKTIGFLAFFIALINSAAMPVFGYLLSKILFVIMNPASLTFVDDRNFWCGMILLLTFVMSIFAFLHRMMFSYVGENLTYNVRKELFEGILYKSVSWFDSKDRAPGILSNILSEDVSKLNGLSTETIALALESFLTIAVGVIISFYFSWRIALVALASSPFLVIGALLSTKL